MKTAGAHRRSHRRRSLRRRRRSILFAGTSTAVATLAAAFSISSFAGGDLAGAAVERARSFIQLMGQRSPGERVKGALTKTKHRYSRVLATRVGPELPIPPLTGSLVNVLAPPAELLPGVITVAEFAPPAEVPPGVTILPPGGGVIVPCCAVFPSPPPGPPSQPSPPPPPPPPPAPPAPPAVPEPATWMTLILGFGLSGWMLRRRRSSERQASR